MWLAPLAAKVRGKALIKLCRGIQLLRTSPLFRDRARSKDRREKYRHPEASGGGVSGDKAYKRQDGTKKAVERAGVRSKVMVGSCISYKDKATLHPNT